MSNAGVGKIFINTEEITFNKAFRIRADLKVDVKIKKKNKEFDLPLAHTDIVASKNERTPPGKFHENVTKT